MRAIVIIPAYEPGNPLIDVVRSLVSSPDFEVVAVDDGSGQDHQEIFARLGELPRTTVLRHAVNLGKGAALKTGLNHVSCSMPGRDAIVTADADGQHLVEDIRAVAHKSAEDPRSLVLGARQFRGPVPLRSRIGNTATRALMRILVGLGLSDTQTGLRGIPSTLIRDLLPLHSTRYEFELDMLILCKRRGIRITEVPIQTVYLSGNRSSHFNPILDSMRVYLVLFRFTLNSLMTALIDILVFRLSFGSTGSIVSSQIAARLIAVGVNYAGVRKAVFHAKRRHVDVFPIYILLVIISGTVSYGLIRLIVLSTSAPVILAKIVAETLMFFVNFAIQRDFIFRADDDDVSG